MLCVASSFVSHLAEDVRTAFFPKKQYWLIYQMVSFIFSSLLIFFWWFYFYSLRELYSFYKVIIWFVVFHSLLVNVTILYCAMLHLYFIFRNIPSGIGYTSIIKVLSWKAWGLGFDTPTYTRHSQPFPVTPALGKQKYKDRSNIFIQLP